MGRADSTTTLDVIQSLPDASSTLSGLVTATAQTITGAKTFASAAVFGALPTGLGMPVLGRSTADVTKNNNTTLADVTGIAFAIGANETWAFRIAMKGISTGVADYKFTLTGPAAPTAVWFGVSSFAPTAGASAAASFGTAVSTDGIGGEEEITMNGLVRNGANAGTVQLQFAQNTAEVSNSVIRADSYVLAFRLV